VRDCGGCTACCWSMGVASLTPPFESCRHIDGRGCLIYDTKPEDCTKFRCLWLDDVDMPDEARPDLIGVIFYLIVDPVDGSDHLAARSSAPGGIQRTSAQTLIEIASRRMEVSIVHDDAVTMRKVGPIEV